MTTTTISNMAYEQTAGNPSTMSWMLSLATWSILITAAVLLGYVLFRTRRALEEQRVRDELAEAEFEARMLAFLAKEQSNKSNVEFEGASPSSASTSDDSVFSSRDLEDIPLVQSASPNTLPGVEETCQRVLQQLRQAGMLDNIESYVELHGNPKAAAVLRMRDRRRVLIVPYYETEAFTERNLHRYDAILYVGRSGKGVFVRSLEDVLSDIFSDPVH